MRIIVSAGGTGGHLYPALALVDYIKKQDPESEFLFVGTTDRLESRVVPQLGYAYKGLNVKGFVGNPIQKLMNLVKFTFSLNQSYHIIKDFKPDIVVGFGGYPSASVVMAASKMGVKTMIHEQNSVIGLTNKVLIKGVDEIVCCYEMAYNNFPKEKTVLLGNPRASVVSEADLKDIHDIYDIDPSRKTAVIVMGSLGSSTVNNTMRDVLKKCEDVDFDVIYVTGSQYYETMKQELGDISENIHLVDYINDMPSLISSCDLIVSRAGATTLAEITALGCPSIIIPSPYVVMNHQEYNAKELESKQAAKVILEKDFNADDFFDTLNALIHDDEALSVMKENALKLGKPNAIKDIYNEILKMTGK